MKLKKVISLGLAATLCLSMFAGCGDKPDPNQGEQGGTTSTPTPDAGNNGDTDEEVRFVENIYDMGGKTIKIHDCWQLKVINDDPTTWSRYEKKLAETVAQIEKDYNVDIVVYNDVYNLAQNIATGAATGEVYANIVVAQTDWTSDWVSGGYAADVSTINNLGLETNDWAELGDWALDAEGVQRGVGYYLEEDPALQLQVLVFNKKLVEQYELENIYELVENGEWTFDKFEEICLDIATKSNGAVKGLLAGALAPVHELGFFALANNADYVIEQDGKYVYNGLSEEAVTGLEFAQKLGTQGIFDMETFNEPGMTEPGQRTHNFAIEERTLFYICSYPWIAMDVDYRLEDYGIVPFPKGPDSEETVGMVSGAKMCYFMDGDPDMEDAAAILVALANRLSVSEEGYYEYQFNRGYIRDEESLNCSLDMIKNKISSYEYQSILPWDVGNALYYTEYTVRQILEQTAQQAQASIDEQFNK